MLTIYSTPVSSNGRKVLATAHQLAIDANVRLVDVYRGEGRTDEYLAINPFGKVPTLVDGDFVVFESNAILQYLSEAHGDYGLFVRAPRTRATISQWRFWESSHWQPAWTTVMRPLAGYRLRPDFFPAPDRDPDWADATIVPLLAYLDDRLRARSWLVEDRLTLADLSVAGMMTYARAGRFPFATYRSISTWYERIEALEAWRSTACELWDPG